MTVLRKSRHGFAVRTASFSRRRFLMALGLGAVALVGGPLRVADARSADGLTGVLVLPRGREVALLRPDGSDDRSILTLQPGEFVADVALSPDGTRVALGLFTARVVDGSGGSDIVIVPTEPGGERTVLVPRDRPGMLLAAPQWSPDGQALVFETAGLDDKRQPRMTVEWVAVDGTGRRTLAEQARQPSFSPDGRRVIYARSARLGDALFEVSLDDGVAAEIVPDGAFLITAYPRYSPDGTMIAFAGVGDVLQPASPRAPLPGPGPAQVPAPPATPKLIVGAGEGTVLREVLAHGFPAEAWVVPAGGGEPRLLAPLPVDDAAIAWSPDGTVVAVSGAVGVHLLGVADGTVRRIADQGSFGAIDWR